MLSMESILINIDLVTFGGKKKNKTKMISMNKVTHPWFVINVFCRIRSVSMT